MAKANKQSATFALHFLANCEVDRVGDEWAFTTTPTMGFYPPLAVCVSPFYCGYAQTTCARTSSVSVARSVREVPTLTTDTCLCGLHCLPSARRASLVDFSVRLTVACGVAST